MFTYLSLYFRVYWVLMKVSPWPPGAHLHVRSLVFLDQHVRLPGFSGGTETSLQIKRFLLSDLTSGDKRHHPKHFLPSDWSFIKLHRPSRCSSGGTQTTTFQNNPEDSHPLPQGPWWGFEPRPWWIPTSAYTDAVGSWSETSRPCPAPDSRSGDVTVQGLTGMMYLTRCQKGASLEVRVTREAPCHTVTEERI